MTNPVPFFRYYLGGTLNQGSLVPHDLDGDGQSELIYTSGGRVVMQALDGTFLWTTPPRGYSGIAGITDLDGDGSAEIVARTRGGSVVLDATTGVVQWVEPADEMGTLSGIDIGDLDGDGLPDLLMRECGQCGVNSGNSGFAYSFAQGFEQPRLLWELPFVGNSRSRALIDVDGVPPLEVLNATYSDFHLVDGATGAVLASLPDAGTRVSYNFCRGHDVDGEAGEEILCIQNSGVLPATDQRRITVLKYTGGETPALRELWPSQIIAPDEGGDIAHVDPFVDLDGDGSIEIVLSTKDPADVWTTRVFDAATGTELARLSGQRIAGTAAIEVADKALVLTTAGATLRAYAFDREQSPALVPRWSLADRTVLTQVDRNRLPISGIYRRLLTIDLDGDGVDELITRSQTEPRMVAYRATGGMASPVVEMVLPEDVDIKGAWVLPSGDERPWLALMRSDGRLVLPRRKSVPAEGMAHLEAERSIRVGSYYAAGGWRDLQRTPLVASLDGGPAQSIVVRDGRNALLVLDASTASMASPPVQMWQRTPAFGASVIANLDGDLPGIVAFGIQEPVTSPRAYRVLGLRSDGSTIFDVPLEGLPLNDILPADLDRDGSPDLVFQWGDATDTLQQTRGITGDTGTTMWNATPLEAGCGRQPAGLATSDWDGDGYTDVLLHGAGKTRVLGGQDGSEVGASVAVGACYFMPTLYDIDGDAAPEVTLHGSSYQPRVLSSDLQTELWAGTDDDRPYPYGAIAPCPAGPVLVEGSWQHPARLKVTNLADESAGSFHTVVLASGQSFPSESAATASGAYLGQLTSATAHTDLTGKGRPTAVVGSADGWLYGFDPCGKELDFAVDFGTAVGEAVFGDTDGDGRDEILVTAADGYLYGLENEAIARPANVLDIDPASGMLDRDVDTVATMDTLSAAWTASPEAASYEVAVLEENGGLLGDPAWQDVGGVTSTSLMGLPLEEGKRYFFVVRAIHADGSRSVDALSDGVIIARPAGSTDGGMDTGPDARTDAGMGAGTGEGNVIHGCGCRASRPHAGAFWPLLLVLPVLLRRRQRPRSA